MTHREELEKRKIEFKAKLQKLDYRYDADYLELIDAFTYWPDKENSGLDRRACSHHQQGYQL